MTKHNHTKPTHSTVSNTQLQDYQNAFKQLALVLDAIHDANHFMHAPNRTLMDTDKASIRFLMETTALYYMDYACDYAQQIDEHLPQD